MLASHAQIKRAKDQQIRDQNRSPQHDRPSDCHRQIARICQHTESARQLIKQAEHCSVQPGRQTRPLLQTGVEPADNALGPEPKPRQSRDAY